MNYQEAKHITLWKLAFCYVEKLDLADMRCFFCDVAREYHSHTDRYGARRADCGKCPVNDLCSYYLKERLEVFARNNGRLTSKFWESIFNRLLALPMPEDYNEHPLL